MSAGSSNVSCFVASAILWTPAVRSMPCYPAHRTRYVPAGPWSGLRLTTASNSRTSPFTIFLAKVSALCQMLGDLIDVGLIHTQRRRRHVSQA